MEEEVREVFRQEAVEKELRLADMETTKGQNMMLHQKEIMSRPARTWFQVCVCVCVCVFVFVCVCVCVCVCV